METTEIHAPTSQWARASFLRADTRMSVYLALCLGICAYAFICLLSKRSDGWPVLNPTSFEIVGFQRRMKFAETAGDLIEKGRQMFPQQPYHMITDTCDLVILPPKFADGIRNNPDLNFILSITEDFHASLPGFQPFRDGREDELSKAVVKKQLTKLLNQITEPLSAETDFAFKQRFGLSTEWKEYNVYDEILDVVARISTRVFLGPELCRNEEWLRITKSYTIDSFVAAFVLRIFPKPLRSIVHWVLPQCKTIRTQFADSKRLILPVIQARREANQRLKEAGKAAESFNDAIDWFDEEAKGEAYDAAQCQLGLSMAAIHTTTDLLTETMQNIMLHPELVAELRQEIINVLSADGWKKTSLYNLKLLDSVIKESQRLRPTAFLSMQRIATRDTKLPDGSILHKGQRCAVDSFGPSGMISSEHYENPSDFDPHRFARMRGQPGLDAKAHLVATGSTHLGFGHGQHSCPGRFFASNEMKVALSHLLIDYEWKFPPDYTPKRMESGFILGTDPKARILIRRRSDPGIDLLSL